ncbi:MAG: heterocyst frequency control protein PatD [Chroococcus sp. CMT-3BRIN-NPC107]|jgi:hypothetical protein|nr:heterocyst frequency control protein PatD [Chroococcus sp. CMT-3BRIN-NPC107]
MLPEYQQFAQLLEQLQAASQKQDVIELRSSYQKAQQFFLEQVLTLEPVDNYQVRSYQTEIAKELQLIGMDVRFLQAAKVPETAAARQKQLLHRLPILLKYCNAILQLTYCL